jgi:hypothetical protein
VHAAVSLDLRPAAGHAAAERKRLGSSRLGRVVNGAFRSAVAAATVLSFLLVCKRTEWDSGFALDSTHTMLHCDGSAQQTANSCVGDHRF